MDLIDRYLAAVRRFLPTAGRDDIVNELADDILSQVKDMEAHLGRPMTEDEVATMLKHRGHPFLLAQRFRTKQYLLIGPALLPFYWQTLKAALALAFLVVVIVTAVLAADGAPPVELLKHLAGFVNVAVYTFGGVTAVYAVLDMAQARLNLLDGWNPRALPPVRREPEPGPGFESFAELIGSGVFLIWWLAVPHYPWVMLGPASALLTFSNAWHALYITTTVPLVVSLLLQVTALVRPQWKWMRYSRRLITNLLTIGVIMLLLGAGDLVVAVSGAKVEPNFIALLNRGVVLSLSIAAAVMAIQIAVDAFRLLRRSRLGAGVAAL
jgi:hypothetical protein